jgi:hypothetical protein
MSRIWIAAATVLLLTACNSTLSPPAGQTEPMTDPTGSLTPTAAKSLGTTVTPTGTPRAAPTARPSAGPTTAPSSTPTAAPATPEPTPVSSTTVPTAGVEATPGELIWRLAAALPTIAEDGERYIACEPAMGSMSAGSLGIVVASANRVCFSGDGLEWRTADLGNAELSGSAVSRTAVVFGFAYDEDYEDERFAVWTSRDGRTWKRHGLPDASFSDVESVPNNSPEGRGFVAVGPDYDEACPGDSGRAAAWISQDGRKWSGPNLMGARCGSLPGSIVVSPSGMLSTGQPGLTKESRWVSTDGSSWTVVPAPFDGWQPATIAAGGPGFVAVGYVCSGSEGDEGCPESVATSGDGVTWHQVPEQPAFLSSPRVRLATYGDLVVAVEAPVPWWIPHEDDDVGAAWTSSDGLTWQRSDSVADGHGTDAIPPFIDIVVRKDVIIALTESGDVWMASARP